MRIFLLSSLLLAITACNDIDGRLRVFKNFSLIDEDGRTRQIKKRHYSADFSYDLDKKEVELEIDNFYRGKDIDFEFYVPHMSEIDFRSEEIEIEVLAADSGQDVDLNALIEQEREKFGPYRSINGRYCRDPYAYYDYPYVIYDIVESSVDVDIEIRRAERTVADDEDDLLAVFEASACRRNAIERYCVDCYGRRYACMYRHS